MNDAGLIASAHVLGW